MNIELFLNYKNDAPDLIVNFSVTDQSETLLVTRSMSLKNALNSIKLCFELSKFNVQNIRLSVSTEDLSIVDYPVEIKNIVLDDFYSIPGMVYHGTNHYDSLFLSYAKKNQIYLDPLVRDNNLLNFTGTLRYNFVWPFFKNIIR